MGAPAAMVRIVNQLVGCQEIINWHCWSVSPAWAWLLGMASGTNW